MKINIYTDGACSGNPGPGGRGSLIIIDKQIIKISGKSINTTNNQMEMQAVIESMIYIGDNILSDKIDWPSSEVSQNISMIYKKYLEPVFFGDNIDIKDIKINNDNAPEITIYTDSKYVYEGINSYIQNRKKNGRKTTARQAVKNQESRQKIDFWNTILKPKRIWVKGHANNKYNNLADKLATGQILADEY